ncbi:dimethyladenosine transferase [Actinobacteria bacterium IMCC25003]|nr:dimethyladenosine transferase [Actinobacteria bacterium IMCC25003]
MDKVRSEILETGNPKIKSARILIEAAPSAIFAIIANPKRHQDFDGSSTITANISGPDELLLGSKFGMKMRLGITYWIRNTVVEYKKDELIAWRHLGHWRWRYELTDLGNGSTQVTESFDGTYAPAIAQVWLNLRKAYPWTQLAVAKTLVRLKSIAEAESR